MDDSIKRYTKQYPIGPATNIDIDVTANSVSLKWTDPVDPILDKIYFSKWEFTRIIRKKDEPPKDTWDGEIITEIYNRNEYKDKYFVDDSVEPNTTYYYAIIPCSDLGKHSWDKLDIMKIKTIDVDPVLQNNTWDAIYTTITNGCIDKKWLPGDTKNITLGGTIDKVVPLTIGSIIKNPLNKFESVGSFDRYLVSFYSKELIEDNVVNIQNCLPEDLLEVMSGDMRCVLNQYKDALDADIYTDDNSRIKTLNGKAVPYNAGDTYVSETGKITEHVGIITSVQGLCIILK